MSTPELVLIAIDAAQVLGVLTFAPGQPPTLELTTTRAVHGTRPFKVAVRTVPHPPQ